MKFTEVTFRPIRRLNYWEVCFAERSFIQCCQERIQQSPLQHSEFFALRQLRVDLMTFQTIDYNLRTSQELDCCLIKASKNNLSEIHISRPTP